MIKDRAHSFFFHLSSMPNLQRHPADGKLSVAPRFCPTSIVEHGLDGSRSACSLITANAAANSLRKLNRLKITLTPTPQARLPEIK
jgi:hypothetical protein